MRSDSKACRALLLLPASASATPTAVDMDSLLEVGRPPLERSPLRREIPALAGEASVRMVLHLKSSRGHQGARKSARAVVEASV